jgi:hypothetical protein
MSSTHRIPRPEGGIEPEPARKPRDPLPHLGGVIALEYQDDVSAAADGMIRFMRSMQRS